MIIGMAGKAEAGKSTIARALQRSLKEDYGVEFEVVSFATPIKLMIKVLLEYAECDLPYDKSDTFLDTDKTIRYLYQTLGTEWGRHLVQESLWSKLVQRKYVDKGINIIIDDLRFMSEFFWVKSYPTSLVVYLNRGGEVIKESSHISENDLHSYMCDLVLDNNKKIEPVVCKIISKFHLK